MSPQSDELTIEQKREYVAETLLGWTRCTYHGEIACSGWLLPFASMHRDPGWLGTWDGAGAVVEAMRSGDNMVGKWVGIISVFQWGYDAAFWPLKELHDDHSHVEHCSAENGPDAVICAAHEALKGAQDA